MEVAAARPKGIRPPMTKAPWLMSHISEAAQSSGRQVGLGDSARLGGFGCGRVGGAAGGLAGAPTANAGALADIRPQ